jgi:N-acetylglutamate synthase-like GNAT family acetyltransferase
MRIRIAKPSDFYFIRDLQKKYTGQIGFLPNQATERELERENFLHGSLNADDAGFLFVVPSLSYQPEIAAIIQAAVRMDAQRQAVGLALVEQTAILASARGQTMLQACCRSDLDSNLFWNAAGFTAIGTKPGGTQRGKDLIVWRRRLTPFADLTAVAKEQFLRGPGGKFTSREKATSIELFAE